ncbi:hypothetical protein BOTCAL_0096g00230 [Botryotinia calthae]|uniref:Uncharacterized protein n=1 Tax=Botryotinia calthae TaxID=38488 RepID=A0A4Y8D8P6_9HELO|nr:hypothetical protein BOTCAL_0096g00230 [Botryotinia calthae]
MFQAPIELSFLISRSQISPPGVEGEEVARSGVEWERMRRWQNTVKKFSTRTDIFAINPANKLRYPTRKQVRTECFHAHGCDEDLSCERETDVGGVGCPDDTKSAGYDAGKGKAECHAGHEEFLAATKVYLEERHVDDGGEEEEEHEDCGDGCVDWVSGLVLGRQKGDGVAETGGGEEGSDEGEKG